MQINSIPGYSLGLTRNLTARRAEVETPTPVQTKEPESEPVKSIYFRGNDEGGLKRTTMGVLIPLTMLTAVGGGMSSCGDKIDIDSLYIEADANAEAEATATATANDSVGYDTTYYHRPDTVIKHDTVYVDTTKCDCDLNRPIPLDTLAKHMKIWDIDGSDTINKRNVVHYEYVREWEYNNKVVADMNLVESSYDKDILVHDAEIKDYTGKTIGYEKHVRRMPTAKVNLENYDGTTTQTKNGIFLEIRKSDKKDASLFDTELKTRYFLQTAGDKVKVYKYVGGNDYVEDGRIGKGYLDKNTILLQDLIGEYSTDDHLVDVKITNITDKELKESMKKAVTIHRDELPSTRSAGTRGGEDPNALENTYVHDAWRNF